MQLDSPHHTTHSLPLEDNIAKVHKYLAVMESENHDTYPEDTINRIGVEQGINTHRKVFSYTPSGNSNHQISRLHSNESAEPEVEHRICLDASQAPTEDSITSAERSIKSQQLGGDILALYHYTMDELMVHAQLAQLHNADPREVVGLFIDTWKRFILLRDDWETPPKLAEFCLRYGLVSWLEPMLDFRLDSDTVFDLYSSACANGEKATVEKIVSHQMGNRSLPIHTIGAAVSSSTRNLLFSIVQSQNANLTRTWGDCCTTLLSRGVISNGQIWETLHRLDPLSGKTALFRACEVFNLTMVNALLSLGANPNHVPIANHHDARAQATPLSYLTSCLSMITQENGAEFNAAVLGLVNKGSNVKSIDKDGNTPLHKLCRASHVCKNAINLLLDHGADPNKCNHAGDTPLHVFFHAEDEPSTSALKELLLKGADPNITNRNQKTPFYYAVTNGHLEQVEILISHCVNNSVTWYGDYAWNAIIRQIIESHKSRTERWLSILRLLITAGGNVHARDNGRTALHALAEIARHDIIRVLLQAGANVNAQDWANNTPLHLAVSKYQSCSQISELEVYITELLAAGADIGMKNIWGESALDILNRAEATLSEAETSFRDRIAGIFEEYSRRWTESITMPGAWI